VSSITIVSDAPNCGVTYDHRSFIIQATGVVIVIVDVDVCHANSHAHVLSHSNIIILWSMLFLPLLMLLLLLLLLLLLQLLLILRLLLFSFLLSLYCSCSCSCFDHSQSLVLALSPSHALAVSVIVIGAIAIVVANWQNLFCSHCFHSSYVDTVAVVAVFPNPFLQENKENYQHSIKHFFLLEKIGKKQSSSRKKAPIVATKAIQQLIQYFFPRLISFNCWRTDITILSFTTLTWRPC